MKEESLSQYRKTAAENGNHLVVLRDFLIGEVAARLSNLLSTSGEFKPVYALVGKYVQENEWLKAPDASRIFKFGKLTESQTQSLFNPRFRQYLSFCKALCDDRFGIFMENVSGLSLGPTALAGPHSMKTGDFMGLHTDDSENRRYTFVIYLTPDWKADYGGALVVVGKGGVEHRVEAEYNSLACFDASAGHYVATINDSAGQNARLTIGGWFLNPK